MDLFENQKQEIYNPAPIQDNFPDLNTKWFPQFDEEIKTKIGSDLDKGSDILKKAMSLYWFGLGLTTLLIILPAIIRFLYEFSNWAYDKSGNIFP